MTSLNGVWRRATGGRRHWRHGTRDCEDTMVAEIQLFRRRTRHAPIYAIGVLALLVVTAGAAFRGYATKHAAPGGAAVTRGSPVDSVADGQRIFRFDTFGDEQFWTDTLHMNQVVEQSVDPTTALAVGLKVDADVLPPGILQKVDLKSPATTVALLKMNAVVGIQATVDSNNHITRLGITRSVTRAWTTRLWPASAIGWTVGPTTISTSELSSLCRPSSARRKRRSTSRGVRASTTRA